MFFPLALLFLVFPRKMASSPLSAPLALIHPDSISMPSLGNVTNSGKILSLPFNNSLSFPPGPEPADPYFYNLRKMHPPLQVKFAWYSMRPGRPESLVYDVFREAIIETGDPFTSAEAIPTRFERRWESEDMMLQMEPQDPPDEGCEPFIWAQLHAALLVMNNFARLYKGLDFVWELFSFPDGDVEECWFGKGFLRWKYPGH